VLHQIPAVAEAAVIGIPNQRWGEVGMAILAVRPATPLPPRRFMRITNRARFKCPRLMELVDAPAAQCDQEDPQADATQQIRRDQPTDMATAIASRVPI
jgi:fatty-acyl-CoA synthase